MRNATKWMKDNGSDMPDYLMKIIAEIYYAGATEAFDTLEAFEYIDKDKLDKAWEHISYVIESGTKSEDPIIDDDYYGFDKTGVLAIDRLLSTVACAIMALADTSSNKRGRSPIQRIQDAANKAAKIMIDK